MIDKKPFVKYDLEKEHNTLTVRINERWRKILDEDMIILYQPKRSTTLKQLALLGHVVLHGGSMAEIIRVALKNKARALRIGVLDEEFP
jgi:hypothetical protein